MNETARLYAVLDKQLSQPLAGSTASREFVAGDYSIADIAIYPWIVAHELQSQKLEDFPHVQRWFEAIKARPATIRAYEKAAAFKHEQISIDQSRDMLFNQSANTVNR